MRMSMNNAVKRIGTELLTYRKKQYMLLRTIIFLIAVFESSITVIIYNESYVLSAGENFSIAIIGLLILLLVFWVTLYSIVYINFCIDRKNFLTLLRSGFTKKELVKSMRPFGRRMSVSNLLLGGISGTGIGIFSTWKYKQTASVFLAIIMVGITYLIIQTALKKCMKKILMSDYNGNGNWRKSKIKEKKSQLKVMSLTGISLKYMRYNWKRAGAVCVLVFLSVFSISYSLSMIRSINIEKYILDTWGKHDYKITLYKEGDMTGDYHFLQTDNPLTEKLEKEITEIDGIEKVVPVYSIQAIIHINDEETEVSIRDCDDDILKEVKQKHIASNEVVISTRSVNLKQVKESVEEKEIQVDYFDGDKKKTLNLKVVDIIVNDSINTRLYVAPQFMGEMMEHSPVLAFYVYGKQDSSIYSRISELIQGKTLQLEDKNTYVKDAKISLNVLVAGIIIVMVMLILFAVSILVNSKFLNIIVRKKDFMALQSIGMTHADIKKMILTEELISNIPSILIAWILGIGMSFFTCNNMGRIGSVFWVFEPAPDSLLWSMLFWVLMSFIELRFYKYVMNNRESI